MIIDIDEEQWEFLHKICIRARIVNASAFPNTISYIDREKDMQKIQSLIDKLEKAKDGRL
jgi:hypothetical protein